MTPMSISPEETALLVIDMQRAFFDNAYSLGQVGMDVEPLRAAIPGVDRVIKTARKHDIPVIYTRYVYQPGLIDFGPQRHERARRRVALGSLAPDSEEIELLPHLDVRADDIVIDKSRPSALYGTRLEPVLNSLRVRNLILCGVTTNVCVETTARDAGQRDLNVFVIEDATAEATEERHRHALESIAWGFGTVLDSAQLAEALADGTEHGDD